MPPLKILAGATALGLATLSLPALADDSALSGVKAMTVDYAGGKVPEVVVHNVAASHLVQNLKLAVQGSTVAVTIGGAVDCLGTTSENLTWRHGTFLREGAYGIGRSSLLLSQALPYSSDIDHVSDMDAHSFNMPVALLANPQIGVDPVAAVLAAADKAPDRLAWLRQDHVIEVTLPIRWESTCAPYSRQKIVKETVIEANATPSFMTRDKPLKIVYKGDPQLVAVNAQLSQGGGLPNQLQAGPSPFKILSLQFQPNLPDHVGACPATTKIRVFYQGQGKGELRIRINDGSTTIHNSPAIAYDGKTGKQHYDFEIATPKPANADLNKTVAHSLRLFVRAKDDNTQTWPASWQPMDSAVWKHRCTPRLNPGLGGTVGGVTQKQPQAKPALPAIRRAQ